MLPSPFTKSYFLILYANVSYDRIETEDSRIYDIGLQVPILMDANLPYSDNNDVIVQNECR